MGVSREETQASQARGPLVAKRCLSPLRGGSQPQLIYATDRKGYVVKFQNNPQGSRILANEMLGGSLATLLGLPVPQAAVIDVSEEMILNQEMVIVLARSRIPCRPGLCFGSRYLEGEAWPPYRSAPENVENLADFLGMLVFDKWTGNTDTRQVALVPNNDRSAYSAIMIDQGFCFAGEEWVFRDKPGQGIAHFPGIYQQVHSLEDFEPWLIRLEKEITLEKLLEAAEDIPRAWYRYDTRALGRLIQELCQRRTLVRGLLKSSLVCFPTTFCNVSFEREAAFA